MDNSTRKKQVDLLCDRLCSIGIDAQVIQRYEKDLHNDIDGYSGEAEILLGKIEVKNSPICWVEERACLRWSNNIYAPPRVAGYKLFFFVKDPSQYNKGYIELRSCRLRTLPIFGKVKSIKWMGNFEGDIVENVIRRLREDLVLNQKLIKLNKDIRIHNTAVGGWYISSKVKEYPSRELWNCYEIIAHQLSET